VAGAIAQAIRQALVGRFVGRRQARGEYLARIGIEPVAEHPLERGEAALGSAP